MAAARMLFFLVQEVEGLSSASIWLCIQVHFNPALIHAFLCRTLCNLSKSPLFQNKEDCGLKLKHRKKKQPRRTKCGFTKAIQVLQDDSNDNTTHWSKERGENAVTSCGNSSKLQFIHESLIGLRSRAMRNPQGEKQKPSCLPRSDVAQGFHTVPSPHG